MAMKDASVVEGLDFPQDKKKFIVDKLDPVLEEMVADIIVEMPSEPEKFMISWLRKRLGRSHRGSQDMCAMPLREQLLAAQEDLAKVQQTAAQCSAAAPTHHDEPEEEEESEDDDMDDLPEHMKIPEEKMTRSRASVSAEAYGAWNTKKDFEAPVYPKSDEQKKKLQEILSNSFMFAGLAAKDMEVVLSAMKEVQFATGTKIIEEGDENADCLYIIETGSPAVKKMIDGELKILKTCNPGDVFGELALLYNCPRAATVEAPEDCVCWELNRETFNHIVKEAATRQRETHNNFLKEVHLLSTLDEYAVGQIADALKTQVIDKADTTVVTEGETGAQAATFYIVEEGTLKAMKDGTQVKEYGHGDYFGELALLKDQPRAATVVTTSDNVKLLTLDRRSFTRLLGPLQSLMAAQAAESY